MRKKIQDIERKRGKIDSVIIACIVLAIGAIECSWKERITRFIYGDDHASWNRGAQVELYMQKG